jgi:molecular chaperone DnaK (HSP70)
LTRNYTTVFDNQKEINVKIFEGEHNLTKYNTKVGDFIFSGIENAKKGIPIF